MGEIDLRMRSQDLTDMTEALKRFEEAAEKIAERGHDVRLFTNHYYRREGATWEAGIELEKPAILQARMEGQIKARLAESFKIFIRCRIKGTRFLSKPKLDLEFAHGGEFLNDVKYIIRVADVTERRSIELEHIGEEKKDERSFED